MRSLPAAFLAFAAAVALAGCADGGSAGGPIACTEEARASVTVAVADRQGRPLLGAAVTWRVRGGPSQPADCVEVGAPPGECSHFVAGWEVAGTIVVEAVAPGYRPASATVVVVMDEVGCHVVGREVELRLTPA